MAQSLPDWVSEALKTTKRSLNRNWSLMSVSACPKLFAFMSDSICSPIVLDFFRPWKHGILSHCTTSPVSFKTKICLKTSRWVIYGRLLAWIWTVASIRIHQSCNNFTVKSSNAGHGSNTSSSACSHRLLPAPTLADAPSCHSHHHHHHEHHSSTGQSWSHDI